MDEHEQRVRTALRTFALSARLLARETARESKRVFFQANDRVAETMANGLARIDGLFPSKPPEPK